MVSVDFKDLLICPVCSGNLQKNENGFECDQPGCSIQYPIVFEIPIMISTDNPSFKQEDFFSQKPPDIFFKTYRNPVLRFLKKIRPDVTLNTRSKKNYADIANLISHISAPKILIIGGSIDGEGILALKDKLPIGTVLIESDVAHGPNTNLIMDAHAIPFKNDSFDLVIAQAVLEHVLDPFQCVKEIHRVLAPGGMIYAETPFMQQVHGGKYDFHRFTHLGHRRLFRSFKEIYSGVIAGAGSAMAWSSLYFITSFASNKKTDKTLELCR